MWLPVYSSPGVCAWVGSMSASGTVPRGLGVSGGGGNDVKPRS